MMARPIVVECQFEARKVLLMHRTEEKGEKIGVKRGLHGKENLRRRKRKEINKKKAGHQISHSPVRSRKDWINPALIITCRFHVS